MSPAPFVVRPDEVLRMLGYKNAPADPATQDAIGRATALLYEQATPRFAARQFDLRIGDTLALVGSALVLPGQSVKALLTDCDACRLLCATLGSAVEGLLRTWQVRDVAFAAVLDVCASVAVEDYLDKKQDEIKAEQAFKGRFLTDRFSPGYGDLPIGIQGDICRILDTPRKIGVSVSESGILIPRKSITAVLGIADTPQPKHLSGCAHCDLFETCALRREGHPCAR